MEFLSDSTAASSVDVILFVREAFERLPEMRDNMLSKLFDNFASLTSPEVARAALWIFGEYATQGDVITATIDHVKVGH